MGSPLSSDKQLDPRLLDELWDFTDPVGSERRFRRALDDPAVGSTARAELTTQLARSVGLQGRFGEALALLDGAVGADVVPAPVLNARLFLERGRVLNSSGDATAATGYFRQALAVAQAAGEDFLAIDAAHMLAIADRERAVRWTDLALRTIDRSADARAARWAGSLHNNAGWARHDAGDFAGALAEFQAAFDAHSANGTIEQVRVARWAVARALRSLGRLDEAMQIQLRLAADGPPDGYVEEELAELLLTTRQGDKARRHAQTAVDLLGADSWFAENEPGRLERLRSIARAD